MGLAFVFGNVDHGVGSLEAVRLLLRSNGFVDVCLVGRLLLEVVGQTGPDAARAACVVAGHLQLSIEFSRLEIVIQRSVGFPLFLLCCVYFLNLFGQS